MTSSTPLLLPLPFPMMTAGPIGAPDWVGQVALRTGNAILHPRRVWAWEMSFDDNNDEEFDEYVLEELHDTPPPLPPKYDPVLRKWPSSIRPVSEQDYSILDRTRYSDISDLPQPGGRSSTLQVPSLTSEFLSVPSPSLRTPPSPTFPASLPVPPPRDPLLGSIITRPRRSSNDRGRDSMTASSSSHPSRRAHDALMSADFEDEVDDFSPPMTSTPHRARATMPSATAAAGTAASNPRRRGLSLASLSLRRRPQVALPRSESTNFSSLGRSTLGRRSIAAASIGKRNGGHGGNDNSVSAMSRSFSSRSFFSNRTFGVGSGPAGPSPESSFLHQKTVTDIDLITLMARNLVESASPIRNEYEDEYYDEYNYNDRSMASRHYDHYDHSYMRGYYADEDRPSAELGNDDLDQSAGNGSRRLDDSQVDNSLRTVESRSRQRRRARKEKEREEREQEREREERERDTYQERYHLHTAGSIPSIASIPSIPDDIEEHNRALAHADDIAERLDRLLQAPTAGLGASNQYLMVTPERAPERARKLSAHSAHSGISADSGGSLPSWLVSAIHVGNTPQPQHRDAEVEVEVAQDKASATLSRPGHGKSLSGGSHAHAHRSHSHNNSNSNPNPSRDDLHRHIWSETTSATQTTEGDHDDDDSDKENYQPPAAYLKRASTSAFGPSCPPPPATVFPQSAPSSPTRAPLRGKAGWRASYGV